MSCSVRGSMADLPSLRARDATIAERRPATTGVTSFASVHTAATAMVNGGASFKDVSDVLGHKSITTTLVYAKLDLKYLMQVALPWPGGAR